MRLNLFVLVLLLVVGLTVLYYTVKEWGPGLIKKEAPVLLSPDGR